MAQFFDYAPIVFANIRMSMGITYEKYMSSLGPDIIMNNLIRGQVASLNELSSEGKSGSIFFYSFDGYFLLKTIKRDEFIFLKQILEQYYNHLQDNPDTLILRFCGLHKIILKPRKSKKDRQKKYFVIMRNVFNTTLEIHQRFDLKGSTHKRTIGKNKYHFSLAFDSLKETQQ